MLLFLEIFTVFFIGLILGSFSTALIYRVPRKLSWTIDRSSCTNCDTDLRTIDLFPLFSWLSTKGKCRYCQSKISITYPLTELSAVVLCLAAYSVFGFSYESLYVFAAIPFLIALLVIDLKHMILPNQLVFILFVIGILRLFYFSISDVFTQVSDVLIPYFYGSLLYALIPWLTGLILTKVLKKDALGFGDVKFFFVTGIWLGIHYLPYFLIMSGGLAIFFALLWRHLLKKDVFPFGPSLIFSFFVLLLFQGSFFV